jgi:hypothetical protein
VPALEPAPALLEEVAVGVELELPGALRSMKRRNASASASNPRSTSDRVDITASRIQL